VSNGTISEMSKRPIRKGHMAHVRTYCSPSHFLTSVATSALSDEVGSLPLRVVLLAALYYFGAFLSASLRYQQAPPLSPGPMRQVFLCRDEGVVVLVNKILKIGAPPRMNNVTTASLPTTSFACYSSRVLPFRS
jgi:hypothetical protein